MTLLSRLGGLARDVIIGRIFGDGALGSAFAAGFAVPNMFRRLLGEGALSAAFIPAYADALRDSRADADRLASMTLAVLAALAGALTVVIELALLLVLLLAPADAERDLSVRLIMVMLPFMPLICIVAILAGMLQVHGRFAPAASGPLILNGFIIAVGAWCLLTGRLGDERVAYALGVATVLSGATQAWWFARLLRPHFSFTRAVGPARPRGANLLKKFLPVAIGLGALQINAFVDMLIAMWPIWVGPTLLGRVYPLDEASNVILALTQRLYQFPLGVFGIAVATAAFPLLARHAKDPEHFADTLARALRLSLYIGLPASAGLILVRHDLTGVLFGHGQTGWEPDSLARSAAVLTGFSAGIWAYSLNHVLTRVFYAKGDTATPMRVSLWMVGLNFTLNASLIWLPGVRESGLAWGTSIAATVQCAVLWFLAKRLLATGARPAPLLDAPARAAIAKAAVATLLMSLCVYAALWLLPPGQGWTLQALRLCVALLTGGVTYLAASLILNSPEWKWLLGRA
jgi:putative peptidoglycan lipid II flippase